MKVFKYLGVSSSHKFFEHRTLRFCQPSSFNDPFELQPNFYFEKDAPLFDQINCSFDLNGESVDWSEFIISEEKADLANSVNIKSILLQLSEQIGILCLTRASSILPNNLLMWAHYGESHQGCAIEFKSSSSFVAQAKSVHYVPEKKVLSANFFTRKGPISISNLYFKSSEWEYENEIRLTKKLTDCTPLEAKDSFGYKIYTTPVIEEDIECVYLGCNASAETKSLAYDFSAKTKIPLVFLTKDTAGFRLMLSTVLNGNFNESFELGKKMIQDVKLI